MIKVELHPTTVKMVNRKHPWILKDSYTEKFPKREGILVGVDRTQMPVCIFLHDPSALQIKGRVWSFLQETKQERKEAIFDLDSELQHRVMQAVSKRFESKNNIYQQRNNFYLIFGEADYIPGVKVQFLNCTILIQLYTRFWQLPRYLNLLKKCLQDALSKYLPQTHIKPQRQHFLLQYRFSGSAPTWVVDNTSNEIETKTVTVTEFGVNYALNFELCDDGGIYSDMASVRKLMIPYIRRLLQPTVLNLYAHTGSFSLLALENGAQKVVSVDLSKSYLSQLELNLQLNLKMNLQLDSGNHLSIVDSVQSAVQKLKQDRGEKFDLIISDPPSCSSDGQRVANALQNHQKNLPHLLELLRDNGLLLLFINTHKISTNTFKRKVGEMISLSTLKLKLKLKSKLEVVRYFHLSEDCPTLTSFPEGDYLKGVLLRLRKT
ncbi:MAG: class I SAM-dependent methyltransferase [Oligoflexia bacterium]|nr:class I SAM-dependent methyltransferase [Oligoflexia bacterium]